MNVEDPEPSASKVNTVTIPHVQQSVTPVIFASTTWVWTGVSVPPTVNTVMPPVSTTRLPLSQIPSVASTFNTIPSLQPLNQNADPCRKCGKNNHSTTMCCKRVKCKKCKGKDHNTRFCTRAPALEIKCTFCRKGKHTTKHCRARRRTEKEAQSGGPSVATNAASNTSPLATGQPQVHPTSTQSLTTLPLYTGLPDTSIPLLPIGQRLHNLAMGKDTNATSTMLLGIPPMQILLLYTILPIIDGNQSYPTPGSTAFMPTLAPDMYNFNHNTGTNIPARAQSITSSITWQCLGDI